MRFHSFSQLVKRLNGKYQHNYGALAFDDDPKWIHEMFDVRVWLVEDINWPDARYVWYTKLTPQSDYW
jgi:hypothetical protein